MQTITTVGLDIAKSVFQVHSVDADGHAVVRRQLKRRYVLAFFQTTLRLVCSIRRASGCRRQASALKFSRYLICGKRRNPQIRCPRTILREHAMKLLRRKFLQLRR